MRVVCVTLFLACFGTNYAIHIGQKAFSEIKSKQGKDHDDTDHDDSHDDDDDHPAGANMHGPIDVPAPPRASTKPIGVEPADPTTRAPTQFPGQPKWWPTTPTTSEVPDLYNPLVATNPEETANLINNLAKPVAKIMIDLAANSPQAKAAGFKPEMLKPWLGDLAVDSAVREGNARTAEGLPSAPNVSMGEDGKWTNYQEPDFSSMSAEETYQHKRDHRQEHLPSRNFKDCPDLDPACVTEQNAQETELFDRMAKDQERRTAAASQSAAEAAAKAEQEVANGKAEKKARRSAWWKKMMSYWTGGAYAADDDDDDEAGAADEQIEAAPPVTSTVEDDRVIEPEDEHAKQVAAAAAPYANGGGGGVEACDAACQEARWKTEKSDHGHDDEERAQDEAAHAHDHDHDVEDTAYGLTHPDEIEKLSGHSYATNNVE